MSNLTKQEQKDYIKRVWSVSSGKKITLMLKKYFGVENKQESLEETARELFT